MATGLRETESVPAYNLKTHSAFKLLTMAAGYKVLCRCHGTGRATRVGGRARFKSLIYLRGDCGRHDDATAGTSGTDSRDGENEGEKKKRKVRRRISLPASRRPRMCDTSLGETLGVLCLSRRIFSFRFLVSPDVFGRKRPRENEEMQRNLVREYLRIGRFLREGI